MPKPRSVLPANLVSQVIDEHSPGSILADFEALLGFVEGGVRSTGKYHLLPMAQLCELDERMTRPLRPRLKRPQQRSFPHLSGLYLLLRATGLGVPEGYGKTSGRLTLDPALHAQWLELNETERYFNQMGQQPQAARARVSRRRPLLQGLARLAVAADRDARQIGYGRPGPMHSRRLRF